MAKYNPRGKKPFDYQPLESKPIESFMRVNWRFIALILGCGLILSQIFNEYRLSKYKEKVGYAFGENREHLEEKHLTELKEKEEEYARNIEKLRSESTTRELVVARKAEERLKPELRRLEEKLNHLGDLNAENLAIYCEIKRRLGKGHNYEERIESNIADLGRNMFEQEKSAMWYVGWVYIGKYVDEKWSDQFFNVEGDPSRLIGKIFENKGDSLINLRVSPPKLDAHAGDKLDRKIAKNDKVFVLGVEKTGQLGGIWAKVEYINYEESETVDCRGWKS